MTGNDMTAADRTISMKPRRRIWTTGVGRTLDRAFPAMVVGCLIACTLTTLVDVNEMTRNGGGAVAHGWTVAALNMTLAVAIAGSLPLIVAVVIERSARIDLGAVAWGLAGTAISVSGALWTVGTGTASGGAIAGIGVFGGLFAHVGNGVGFGRSTWGAWAWTLLACLVTMAVMIAAWMTLPPMMLEDT